jgi:hypothetical protein
MATVAEQLYSQTHWIAPFDGIQTTWNFTFEGPEGFGYIFPEHVKAYYLDEAGERIDLVVVEADLIGEFQLEIDPPIPATATRLVIYRDTPKDEPLVNFADGAQHTEANLDRIAMQAVFVAAEVLDGASVSGASLDSVLERLATLEGVGLDTSVFGYKSLRRNTYTGSSNVLSSDNGKAHYKTDASAVNVPTGLAVETLVTIVNNNASSMSLAFTGSTAYLQDGDSTSGAAWTIAPRSSATIWHADTNVWLLSGAVAAA